MHATKTTDAMLDKISEQMKEIDRLRMVIASANARYDRSAWEEPSFQVATDMYIELAAAGDVEAALVGKSTDSEAT